MAAHPFSCASSPVAPDCDADSTLTGFQIVYFGNDWFAENRTSSHHIARRLAERVPVLYAETPGTRPPQATRRDFRKIWKKLTATLRPPHAVGPQIWVVTVPQIPFGKWPLITRLNRLLSVFLLRRAQRRLGFQNTISWFVVPHVSELAGRLGEKCIIYYCIDDYAAFPHVDRETVERHDRELTSRADQVFVASPWLLEQKKQLNRTAAYSPHGVDFEHFGKAADPNQDAAEPVRTLSHPIIGFFGLIETWIDLDLIERLAKARPDWTFLLIGRLAVDPGELRMLPNVIFAGPQPYETLPAWARAFDVAIIPYRHTRQVFNANPLKLREYLATGKPVVAVRTPEIETFSRYVRIADSPEQFLGHIDEALLDDDTAARDARMRAVASMSWDARVDEVLRIVNRRLQEMRLFVPRA